jgi:hypothetical protein
MLRALSFLSVFDPLPHETKKRAKAQMQKYLRFVFKILLLMEDLFRKI